ncbi:MAG TPA: response regulator, partial [Nevskiaceae bacterium]|nr:response regulator [Nevskiaceae bacterium]
EQDGSLVYCAAYGLPDARARQQRFGRGEGLPGQCLLERRLLSLDPVPAQHFQIISGLGKALPRSILLVPLIARGEPVAVLELASFARLEERQQRLLEDLLPATALSWQTLARSLLTRELLEETQAQAEELRASEEALRTQQEELRVTNEALRERSQALEEQGRRLRSSEEELRLQAQELRISNSELQDARGELEQKAEALAQASRYKSEFLANMSHELRTPLNSLLILSQSLAENEDGNLNEEQIESARIIRDSGRNLLNLINDILDLSKVEAGKMQITLEEVSLAALLQQMERQFRPVARERALEFVVERAADLPETLRSDGARLGQILTNLLGNAFKFTRQGRVSLRVGRPDASERLPAGWVAEQSLAFEVSDTGIGIAESKLEQVFQAFEQADASTSRRFGGTGLGLSIVIGMARLLGGEVRVRSQLEVGSTFTLLVPQTLADAVAEPVLSTPPAPAPRPAPAALPTAVANPPDADEDDDAVLLIVEDDPVFARLLAEAARRKGHATRIAGTGQDALRLARSLRLSGVLLDLGLPDISGWQVLSQFQQDPRLARVPVHIVSADDEAAQGLDRGAVGVLMKPATREGIQAALDRLQAPGTHAAGLRSRVLLVDDDSISRAAVRKLLASQPIDLVEVDSGSAGLQALTERGPFDGLILDLYLPDLSGFDFLEQAARRLPLPPVVIYSARQLTDEETLRLREYTESIVIKGSRSPERLLDEASLFLHSLERKPAAPGRAAAPTAPAAPAAGPAAVGRHPPQEDLGGRTVLVVDDDMRNIFALSKALRSRGLKVVMAQDGLKALSLLESGEAIDLVLMDIMMPDMDGYETMRRIRAQPRFASLPIIAVTAKAMKGDREKCLEAGANDYCTKPVDLDRLISQIRVWV